MSRTIRRKVPFGKTDLFYAMRNHDVSCFEYPVPPQHDPKSKEGRRIIARYHADIGTHSFKEPGPAWYRNIFTERPQRREAVRQLQKYLKDDSYEVMLNGKDPLHYWT